MTRSVKWLFNELTVYFEHTWCLYDVVATRILQNNVVSKDSTFKAETMQLT